MILVREGRFISSCSCSKLSNRPDVSIIPRGSWDVGKDTGENSPVEAGVPVAKAMLWEEPQAILVMR